MAHHSCLSKTCCHSSSDGEELRKGVEELHPSCLEKDPACTIPPSPSTITSGASTITANLGTQDIPISVSEQRGPISSDTRSNSISEEQARVLCDEASLDCCHQPTRSTRCCSLAQAPVSFPMPCCIAPQIHHTHNGNTEHTESHFGSRAKSSGAHSHELNLCCPKTPILGGKWLNELDEDLEDPNDSQQRPVTYERIILTIEGLKCGCCENGISRAIGQIPAIRDHQVNIVLARIEFDLDTTRLSVAGVIRNLHRTTGYTFEEYIQPEGQILELLIGDPTEIYQAGKPYGVTLLDSGTKQMWNPSRLWSGRSSAISKELGDPDSISTSLCQHTVRVHYNAKQIGARDIFEYYQQLAPSQSLQLPPPSTHASLAVGVKQTWRALRVYIYSLTLTLPILVLAWAPLDREKLVYAHISLALASIIQVIAIKEFLPGALRSLVHSGLFEMDFLIALSTTMAYVFSVVSYVFQLHKKPLETGSFFETSALLVTLILLGRLVSEFARLRATKSVSFRSLQVEEALLVIPSGAVGTERETRKIDIRILQYGDIFKVPPHTRIVTDGKVIYGGSEVDESMITGEPIPVAKGLEHKVYAGTMNGNGQLIVALTALPHENSINKIATMVENAELTKPKAQALADRIAGWFVPAMAIIGTLVLLIWLLVDRYHNHRSWGNAVVKAITYTIATLIVSCPCAIGLAVPMVVLIASGVSARFGVIFRDPQKLEVARNVTDIIFDKTGTITTGILTVMSAEFKEEDPTATKSMLWGLLRDETHPVSLAVLKWLERDARNGLPKIIRPSEITNVKSIPGNGIIGQCNRNKAEIRVGHPEWLGIEILKTNHTIICVTVCGYLMATFRLKDRPRLTAEPVVKELHARGIVVHMLSGDSEGVVNDIAHTLNIPRNRAHYRLKPEDKQAYIHRLQTAGRVVMFVGDGTNDAIALKQADVGVHMNHGSDVAKGASDVVLMTAHLHEILILLDISRAAYRRIILNFSWSAVYNIVAVLMTAGAFVKVRIEPAYAGLGELVSVLPVVLIAFQMRWRDYGKKYRTLEWDAMR